MKKLILPPLSGPLISKDVPYLWNGSLVPAQHGDYEIYYEVVDTPSTQWSTDNKLTEWLDPVASIGLEHLKYV